MAGDILDRAGQNKLRLGIYFIKNVEIRYSWGFVPSEILK